MSATPVALFYEPGCCTSMQLQWRRTLVRMISIVQFLLSLFFNPASSLIIQQHEMKRFQLDLNHLVTAQRSTIDLWHLSACAVYFQKP